MEFLDVIETAEWLGKTYDVAKLKRLKELTDNQRFYVTVWGHYSAGKSKLINNILGRDILPVQSRETTAALTYIHYGTQEECVLIYEDGAAVKYELSILKDVFQNTSRFEKMSKIDHIEVYIHDELLNTGLILVDTPGVNTVIQRHQDLAASAIEQSGRIIYVLGNAPTNTDKQFIKEISDCGIKISFVRTKCDRFNENEENPDTSLKKEKDKLEIFTGTEVDFIPVSNEKQSKWNKNIEKVRELIRTISKSLAYEMEQAGHKRLSVYASQYLKDIAIEEEHLNDIKTGDMAKVDAERIQYETDIKMLKAIIDDIENKIENRVVNAKKESEKELDRLISARVETFAAELSTIELNTNVSDEIKGIYSSHLSDTIGRFQKLLNTYFEGIIQEETENLLECVSDHSLSLPVPTYAEVQQENSRILEMYSSKLLEVKQQIERIKEQQSLNEEALSVAKAGFSESDYDKALAILDDELSEIPSGVALRLAENQDIQPSTVFKRIGNVIDVALLLLPGDAVVAGIKGVADTTKIAQTLHKMGKAGEVIVKAGSTVGKNAKAIDRVRDTFYAVNQVLGKRKYSTRVEKETATKLVNGVAQKGQEAFVAFKENKKSGNVLDALSVAYWMEKVGKNFDSEPKMEIDREAQDERNQLRKRITSQQQELYDERMRRKKELGLLQNKQAELKIKLEEEELKKKRIEEEFNKKEQIVINQVRINALNKYRREYNVYYRESITNLASEMIDQYFRTASQNITMYVASQGKEVMNRITEKTNQLQELLLLKEKGNKEIENKLIKCQELKRKMELVN